MPQHSIETLQQNHRGSKRRGELAELAFLYRASSEGISVAKPYGDSHPYDFLVQHGRRLLRIQVKSTFKDPTAKRRFGYQVIVARSARKAQGTSYYSLDEIDFVVPSSLPSIPGTSSPSKNSDAATPSASFPKAKASPSADYLSSTSRPGIS